MERAILTFFVGAKLLVHLAFNAGYGVFRDELYYLACADHLAWGYVDHPPLVAVFAWLARALFGTSAFGLRVLPAVAASALMALTWRLTRALGGRAFAQALACVSVLAAPELLGDHSYLSMNVLEHVFWIAVEVVLVRAVAEDRPRLLLWLGPLVGLGLLDKHSMSWLVCGLALGLAVTPERRWLLKRELLLAAGIAAALFLPHVVWQVRNDFPTLEFMRNAQAEKNVHLPMLAFWKSLTEDMNPIAAPVWLAGLVGLLVRRDLARFRFLGIATLLVFALVTWQKGKTYYLAPAFPALYAAGGVVLERLAARAPRARRVVWLALAPIAVAGAVAAPLALPILPPAELPAYAQRLGVVPESAERSELGVLPQFFADRFGWREMSAQVRAVYAGLAPDERARAAILARNYGEASAIALYGEGPARVISTHNAYFTWGYGDPAPEVLVTIGFGRPRLEREFEEVIEAARFSHPLAMPYESDNPIFVCRRPKRAFEQIWRSYKHFI